MAKDSDSNRRKPPPPTGEKASRSGVRKGNANRELTAQKRRLLGKHYAAKHGVRKGQG